ncbi:YeeE/YedE family protein [Alteromonas halophila]|uniref:Transporter n=1 Tax=Alteromonas halophila TaxID=516698 RepID=A0A918JNU7_9ALTE|nr:YeeE/YedE family protein [Alteromonas halophila]GGW88748.1 transporter [Alteromonas halophila]
MLKLLTALMSGLLIGAGLTISTMVDPKRVLGFLDILGNWDPTLIFVMGGALLVYMPVYQLYIKKHKTTLLSEPCQIPDNHKADKSLVVGAILFGIGWGLSGICPGPGLANLSGGNEKIFAFVLSMLIGMLAHHWWAKSRAN